jgi:hypothetical protein
MVPPAASPCDRPHPCRFFPFLPSCALPHSWHLHGSHAPVTFKSQWMCLESVMRWTRRFACHDIHGRIHSDACCRVWVKYTIDSSYVYCSYQVGVAGKRRPPQHDDAVAGGGLAEGNLAGRRVSAGVFPLTCLSLDSVSVCVCVCIRFDSPRTNASSSVPLRHRSSGCLPASRPLPRHFALPIWLPAAAPCLCTRDSPTLISASDINICKSQSTIHNTRHCQSHAPGNTH